MQRLDTLRFALAGAIYGAGLVALATICTLLGIPGFKPFTDLLVQFYGFYGYSVSATGVAVGAFWGLVEGFVHFGIFAWLYNVLLGTAKTPKAGNGRLPAGSSGKVDGVEQNESVRLSAFPSLIAATSNASSETS